MSEWCPDWLRSAPKRRRYLVGVSGGADSVALLQLLVRAKFRDLVVCHLDHGLRGEDSAGDARFVRGLAKRLKLPAEIARAEVAARAGGRSLETAGREARHDFFADCGRRWRCRRLLLAHHADDQAETVMWNLLRGSRGSSGMADEQEIVMAGRVMTVIRPLLGCRRRELRDWLVAARLRWREDVSNREPVAVRNRLRHEVLPGLVEITGRDVVPALLRDAAADRELREIEAWAVKEARVEDPQGRVHLPRLRSLPAALQRACLWAFLRRNGVPDLGRAEVERVMAMLEPGGDPATTLPGGRILRRRQGRLLLE